MTLNMNSITGSILDDVGIIDSFVEKVRGWRYLTPYQADDVVIETLEQLATKIANGEKIENPLAWLLSSAKFVRLAVLRRQHEHSQFYESRDPNEIVDKEVPKRPISTKTHQISKRLHAVVAKLSENQQAVLWMHGVKDISIAEVAKALGVPRSTANSWYQRACHRIEANQDLNELVGE